MKNAQAIPVYIKPKLIPFLVKEFYGTEARYLNKQVKAIDIDISTPLGSFIRLQMDKLDYPVKDISKFNMFLKIKDVETAHFGRLYSYTKGQNNFLHLPKHAVDHINDYLECVFQTALFNFLDAWHYCGMLTKAEGISIIEGIFHFMEKYELMEQDFNPESIRRQYYRWKNNSHSLKKFHVKFTKNPKSYVTT